MIVDCHTHIWETPEQLGAGYADCVRRDSGGQTISAGASAHALASQCVDTSLVIGLVSRRGGLDVPNESIADYVAGHADKAIGIAAVDPTDRNLLQAADDWLGRSEFRGLTISPSLQGFHPADSRAMPLYELACERAVPVFFHQDTHFLTDACMEYARPALLDEIAREYPSLTIVVSSLGHPWMAECLTLLAKHPRVYGDLAGLTRRPWAAYNALVSAHQFGVMDKVLFGSEFPYSTAAQAIEAIYRLNELTHATNLPSVPREALRSVVERDALTALGLA